MDKTTRNILIVMLLIAICWAFSVPKFMRYLITGDKDIKVYPPSGFYFSIAGEEDSDLYEVIDIFKKTYYITVKEEFLNNDDAEVYVTGSYRNSPTKPLVKLNGKEIDDLFIENDGYADGVFSDHYFSKLYHFTINDTIEEDKEYKFYVRVADVSDSITIIFTTRDTDDGELIEEEEGGWPWS